MSSEQNCIQSNKRPFLGIYFVRCKAYGRLYRNKDETAYIGQCPNCRKPVIITIGTNGTSARFFKVLCL